MDEKNNQELKKSKVEVMLKVLTICIKAVMMIGGISLLYKIITDGMKKDEDMRDVTPSESKIPLKEIIVNIKKTPALLCNLLNYIPYSVRLKYIKNKLNSPNPMEKEAASLLLATTFENFLITLYKHGLPYSYEKIQKNKTEGIVNKGKQLRDLSIITREEYDLIKNFAKIRNLVVHGNFESINLSDIKNYLPKIEEMINEYEKYINHRKEA